MKNDLKRVTIPRGYRGLHVEARGVIVNVIEGLSDADGRPTTTIEIRGSNNTDERWTTAWLDGTRVHYITVPFSLTEGRKAQKENRNDCD